MVNDIRAGAVRAVQAVIYRLLAERPETALHLAGRIGMLAALRRDSWRAPAAEKLSALLGPLDAPRMRRIRRQVASLQSRNDLLGDILRRRGVEVLDDLIADVRAEPLLRCRERGEAVIAVGWHQGPLRASSRAFAKLGIPALFAVMQILREPDRAGDCVRYADLSDRAAEARFMKRAHQALRDGVVVGSYLDCAWSGEEVAFFGRRIVMGRSAVSLARLTGARLVPMSQRFIGSTGRMQVTFGEPIDDADLDARAGVAYDRALLARAAQRLEAEARNDPGSWRASRVHWLLAAPPVSCEGLREAGR